MIYDSHRIRVQSCVQSTVATCVVDVYFYYTIVLCLEFMFTGHHNIPLWLIHDHFEYQYVEYIMC